MRVPRGHALFFISYGSVMAKMLIVNGIIKTIRKTAPHMTCSGPKAKVEAIMVLYRNLMARRTWLK